MCFGPFLIPATASISGGSLVLTEAAINWTAVMAASSLASGAGGLLMQVGAQRAATEAAQQRGAYEAAVARNNMILAERAAVNAEQRGEIEAKQQRLKTSQLIGQQRAGFAAHGVLVDEGSAGDVTEDTAAFGKLDELTIKHNAEREALGFRTQGMNFQASGELAQLRAFQPDTTFGTILTGSSALLGRFVDYNTLGRRRRVTA